MTRIDGTLNITAEQPTRQDRAYSSKQVIDVLDGVILGGGGGSVGRLLQTATYITRTVNPTGVFYTALDVDQNVILPRTQLGVRVALAGPGWTMYAFDQPLSDGLLDWVAIWDEGVIADYTASQETVGSIAGIGTGGGGGAGLAHASFTATQSTSSLLTVDATASTGDSYAWELDTVPRPETTAVVTYGPLLVGTHHVKLTVTDSTDGSTSVSQRDVDVAWVADPLNGAIRDNVNGILAGAIDLPQWSTIAPIGPWATVTGLNELEGYPGTGDGQSRMTLASGVMTSFVETTDSITGNTGNQRIGLQWNSGYDGRPAGYPAAVQNIDVTGVGLGDGHSGSVRFYRVEVMVPTLHADGTTQTVPWLGINNIWEIEVTASSIGAPLVGYSTNAEGTYWRMNLTPAVLGVTGTTKICCHKQIVLDQWVNRVIEIMWDLDPAVGYVRIWEDGDFLVAGDGSGLSPGMPVGTDSQGRYFFSTARTNSLGVLPIPEHNIELYRNAGYINTLHPEDTTPRTVKHRKMRVGPTMASVMAL